jgi:hypothetical protein
MGGLIVRSVLNYIEQHPEVVEQLLAAAIASVVAHLTSSGAGNAPAHPTPGA